VGKGKTINISMMEGMEDVEKDGEEHFANFSMQKGQNWKNCHFVQTPLGGGR